MDHVKDFLTPADINKYGLVRILKAMTDSNTKESLLQTLYPDRNFQEIVQKHLPDSGRFNFIGVQFSRSVFGQIFCPIYFRANN